MDDDQHDSAGPSATSDRVPPPVPTAPASPAPPSFEDQAQAISATAASPSMRWPMSLVTMGILLVLLSIFVWWAQDAAGTVVNQGETKIGQELTFEADGGTYRLLSSGPLRPAPEATWCQITTSDGKTRREVGGQGLQTDRLGVDRLLTFHPPAGTTTVRCTHRGSDSFGGGRYQVIAAGGVTAWAPYGVLGLGLLSIAIGAAWAWSVVARFRSARA